MNTPAPTPLPFICPTCGLALRRSPYQPDRHRSPANNGPCYLCTTFPLVQSLAENRAKIVHDLPDAVAHYMAMAGVPKRLRTATLEDTTPEIKDEIHDEHPGTFASGLVPSNGWGFIGEPGIGKSGANAALCARHIKNALARQITQYCGEGITFSSSGLLWVEWSGSFAHLQSHAIDPETPLFIDRMKRAKVLVLDDLGRERFPKDYKERTSFGHDALFQVISHRNGQRAPILWTSNFKAVVLLDLYGAPVFTRLTEENPPIELSSTMNRRIR